MAWNVSVTDTFSAEFKKYSKNKEFIHALDAKIKRLQENPKNVGSFLAGNLYGLKAMRLLKNFRIIFRIDEEKHLVFLEAIDHRKHNYENF